MVMQDFLKRLLSRKGKYEETWFAIRERMLSIYREAISSSCHDLVRMIQIFVVFQMNSGLVFCFRLVIHDEFLVQKIEVVRNSENNHLPPPLEHLQFFAMDLKSEANFDEKYSSARIAASSCMRDMYHYARVSGVHTLECIMDSALSAIKREQLQEATAVLSLFPRLQPLVAAMGWDLLSGKTTVRRKLMQVLWTSKSQVLRLEESSLYGNQLNEVSAIENL